MRIIADVASIVSAERLVVVEHGEGSQARKITFPLSLYKKNNFSQDNETFQAINEYWASLPNQEQEEIYAVYEDIRELFDSVTGNTELREELIILVKKLMSHHHTKRMQDWIHHKSRLVVPTKGPKGIKRTFEFDVDKSTTIDRTYIYDDYVGLMALSVIFRAMIPIWAMFNKPAKDAIGKVLKEMHAFLLLSESEVYTSESLERLKRYIKANISKDTYTGNHTLEFICSDDMPFYLLSLVCVRKLCLGELYEEDPRQNLAALVYTYIIDRPGPNGGDHSQQVQTKKLQKEGAGETNEHSGSTLELYKARASITVGRIAEMEYSLRDPVNLAIQLCPGADEQQVAADCERALITAKAMLVHPGIQIPQIILAQWVINPVFPAQGLLYVKEDPITHDELLHRICALVETVLRHREFGYLALLSTAVPVNDETSMNVVSVGSRSQIGEDLANALAENFPFKREPKRKTPTNSSYDFVQEDIKKLSQDFSQFTWRATADEALVRSVLKTHVRRIPIPPNLRADIGNMLVKAEEELN